MPRPKLTANLHPLREVLFHLRRAELACRKLVRSHPPACPCPLCRDEDTHTLAWQAFKEIAALHDELSARPETPTEPAETPHDEHEGGQP